MKRSPLTPAVALSRVRRSVLAWAALLCVALPAALHAQSVEKIGQAEVPILEDNLDAARTRAIREAQVQAVGRYVADLVAAEWITLYDKELRRTVYGRVDRYITGFRAQRLEASADRTRYTAAITAQVARSALVEDLRDLGLPILTDPPKNVRILFAANDPILSQPPLRASVLEALQPRLESLKYKVTGSGSVEPSVGEWLQAANSDNARRSDFLSKQRQDAVLYLAFRMGTPGTAAANSGLKAVMYQGSGGFVLTDLDRQSAAPAPRAGEPRQREYVLAELVTPMAQQLQPSAIRSFRTAGAGTRLTLRVTGFDSIAEEESFEAAFFRRNSPFANFSVQRIEPDAIVYEGPFGGNRETLDRELGGKQVGDFKVSNVTWMDAVLEMEVARTVPPQHLEPELFPVEKRPPQVQEILQAFFSRSSALEVQDPLYTEREDNGWLDRANQLPFNATVYGQVDSRTDADFYVAENLAEGENVDIIWYRPDRTNLSPVIRLLDEQGKPVRAYYPRAYTRFSYKVPPGQHGFYLEITDRFGFLKIDGSGYQKFHYLLQVKRQSNR